ncbi:MAG: hypothetical protein QG653_596, partial [Patescibacteria group bacterium]|nr:hypothetical protein [Patescibacteria group bacterium]
IGAFSKIGEFTVAVGSKGGIMLASSTLELSISGITNPQITYDQVQIREGGSWLNAAQVFPHTENGVMKLGINLRQGYGFDVNAGQSRTFSVYATIKGQAQPGIIPCVQSKFNSTNPHFSFFDISRSPTLWRDARSISNFPTNAYSTKDCSQISQVSKPTFALTAGFTSQTVSPNTTGVKVGSFTIQAPSNEAIKVSQLTATPAITSGPVYNVTNLSIKSNGSSLGIPVANPLGAYATFSFPEITIQAGQTRVFDVYADIGSASPASVKTAMTVWYKGAVNNTSGTVSAEGVNISSVVAGGLSATLSPLSPVSQYVVGCSSFNIATFKIKTTTPGTSVVVEGLRFAATGGDTIRSITVAGITRDFSAPFSGLSIPVSSTGVDVPVTVAFNGLQDSLCGGPLIASVPNVSLILKEVVGRSGGSTVVGPVNVSSNQMTLVASKPTVAMKQGGTSPLVLNGGETKIAEFTVSADLQGGLAIDSLKLAPTVSASGVTFSNPRIAGIDGTIPSATLSVEPIYTTLQTIVVKFNQGYEIGAGKTETFSVYAKVTSSIPVNTSFFIATRFLSPLDFKWRDIVGGNTLLDGSKIMNFPTGAYRTGDILTTPAANITSVTPSQGTAGTVVTINGNYLSGITRVEFIKATYEVVGVLQASQMTTVTPSAVTFTLPSIITTAIAPGNNYQVRVVSSGCTTGCTSNMLPFTFTTPVTPVAPTINTLYINPPALLAGQTTNLHWSTTNATSCTLNGIPQPQAANGISPITSAGTYTLSCTGPGGSVTKSFTVASQPTVTLPTITSFVASPSSIQSGQSTVISWSTKDATICTLNGAPQSQVVNGVSVGQGGNYTLACSGPGGNVSKSLTVSVYVVDPVICQDGRPPVNGTCQPTPVLTPIYSSQVTALYRVFLGRAPDSVGAPYFQQKLNSGTTITDAGWEMLTSPEGTTKWGGVATTISNEAYIDLLYKILLGYTPTAEIRNSWVQTLANGTSRKDILQQFISYPDTRTKNPDLFMVPATNSFQVLASSIRSLESVYREATQGTVALSAPTTLTAVTEEIINFTGLQRGANEVRVSSLKKILNTISPSVSIGCANLSTTNTLYGPTTEECVRVFQNLNELEPTGSVNEQTNKALNRVLAR